MDFLDYQYDLPRFNHAPFRGPRCDLGEQAFYDTWQGMMALPVDCSDMHGIQQPPNAVFATIFESKVASRLDQRSATVAASVVVWLATNCGQDYLRQANLLHDELLGTPSEVSLSRAHVMTMSLENQRRHGLAHGARLIEILLAPDDHWETNDHGHRTELRRSPELRTMDFDVLEAVAAFLGENAGQKFLKDATARWDAMKRVRRLQTAS